MDKKFQSYSFRIKEIVYELKDLVGEVSKKQLKPNFGARKDFCNDAQSFISNYNMDDFIEKFIMIVNNTYREELIYQQSFFCSLCDADQQGFFNIKEKTVLFKENFCHEYI